MQKVNVGEIRGGNYFPWLRHLDDISQESLPTNAIFNPRLKNASSISHPILHAAETSSSFKIRPSLQNMPVFLPQLLRVSRKLDVMSRLDLLRQIFEIPL
jgi:hypothetical protein